jgi:very-short-patch-repair endonuclease
MRKRSYLGTASELLQNLKSINRELLIAARADIPVEAAQALNDARDLPLVALRTVQPTNRTIHVPVDELPVTRFNAAAERSKKKWDLLFQSIVNRLDATSCADCREVSQLPATSAQQNRVIGKSDMNFPHLRRVGQCRGDAVRIALYAKHHRQYPTDAESAMCDIFAKFCPVVRFRRQQPMFKRIADFYCRELRLVVEVDGKSHLAPDAKRRDAEANYMYQENGYHIFRVKNWQVMQTPEKVGCILLNLIHLLRCSDEHRLSTLGLCVIVSFDEDPNQFRLCEMN